MEKWSKRFKTRVITKNEFKLIAHNAERFDNGSFYRN